MKPTFNRIIVLDDDPDIGTMIKLMLEYHGYAVKVTHRAEDAQLLIATEDFDLLIMDMLLSGVNGIDICTYLKKESSTNQLPVIMISAHPNAKEICINAGANDFIAKPFDMDELLSKIDRFVPQPGKI